MSEVAAIAAGLTKAQREALQSERLSKHLANPINRTHYALMCPHIRAAHNLVRKELLDVFTDRYGDRHSGLHTEHRFALTPLGLAVRATLAQQEPKNVR